MPYRLHSGVKHTASFFRSPYLSAVSIIIATMNSGSSLKHILRPAKLMRMQRSATIVNHKS